jgi:flagellar biosynthesis GTPase FlhF
MSAPKDKDRYRFEQNVFKVSREKKDIKKALEEWELVDHKFNDDPTKKFQCICNSHPWKDQSTYYNPFTQLPVWVGSECAKKFKKHAKPGMKNGAAQSMFKDILTGMTADEKLQYKDIANILAYCQGVIDSLVAHVEEKLLEGIPVALEQLIECLTGIYQRQQELYLPAQHIASLLQRLKDRLRVLEIQALALAAEEAVRRQKEAEEAAARKAKHEAFLAEAAARRQKEAEEAEARKAEEERRLQQVAEQAAKYKREREERERQQRAERAERERKEQAERAARQQRIYEDNMERIQRAKEVIADVLDEHGTEDAYLLNLRIKCAAKVAARK